MPLPTEASAAAGTFVTSETIVESAVPFGSAPVLADVPLEVVLMTISATTTATDRDDAADHQRNPGTHLGAMFGLPLDRDLLRVVKRCLLLLALPIACLDLLPAMPVLCTDRTGLVARVPTRRHDCGADTRPQ